jgi:hypothetical protein
MNIDDLQQLWRSQGAPSAASPEATSRLVERIRADAEAFERTTWARDLREFAASVVVSAFFGFIAYRASLDGRAVWPLVVAALTPLAVVSVLFIDRLRHAHLQPVPGEPLSAALDRALARLRHQATLLKQVLWWYLVPLSVSSGLVAYDGVARTGAPLVVRLGLGAFMAVLLVSVGVWVYRLNRKALETGILPKIRELEEQRMALAARG